MFKISVDLSDIEGLKDLGDRVEQETRKAAADLSQAVHGRVVELASERLHTRRQAFVDAVSFQQVNEDTFLIVLDKSAVWIDEGQCVVYGDNGFTPKVLTPDGWVSILDAKIGMLVLNQYGNWTKILKIHERPLHSGCLEDIDDEETFARFGYWPDEWMKSRQPVVMKCRRCGRTKVKAKQTVGRTNPPYCDVCCLDQEVVFIKSAFHKRHGTLALTPEHPVLTPDGWIPAGQLNARATLMAPAWGKCRRCSGKKIHGEGEVCSAACGASIKQRYMVANGSHPSQQPEWIKDVFKKKIALGKRVSAAEDATAVLLVELGYSVAFHGTGSAVTADWVRQKPVSLVDETGVKRCYWPDFFCPRTGLAIEIDGSAFHTGKARVARDRLRDQRLKTVGVDVVRVPAQNVRKKTFKYTLQAIASNHEGDIKMRPVRVGVKKVRTNKAFPLLKAWDITVAEGSSFVCQGLVIHNSKHSMVEALLSGKHVKVNSKGEKYAVVPFKHGPGLGTTVTPAQNSLTQTIKAKLKSEGIPFGKIEKDAAGRPKLGMLHQLDITDKPLKTAEGPGQGKGPIGAAKQGPTGIPFLQGIRIYQREAAKVGGGTTVKRSIMTFRTVTAKHAAEGRWEHPGLDAKNIMEDAYKWGLDLWDTIMRDKVLDRILGLGLTS